MKLVIEIDKDKNDRLDYLDVITLKEIIRNGKPLPKGHGDLIDRKELLKQPMDNVFYPSNYVRIAPPIIEADKESEE